MARRIAGWWLALAAGWLVALADQAGAQVRPERGLIHDRERGGSLSYMCFLTDGSTLQCLMFQSVALKRWSKERVAAEVAKERAKFDPKQMAWAEVMCQEHQNTLDMLEGRKPLAPDSEIASWTAADKSFMKKSAAAWLTYCAKPTVDNWVRTIEVDRSRQLGTCTIRQNMYSQAFRWIKGPTEERSAWVAVPEQPDAEKAEDASSCSFVDVSRFEPSRDAKTKELSWSFFARRQATNPKGALSRGLPCDLVDTKEYTFTGAEGVFPMQCDFIEYNEL